MTEKEKMLSGRLYIASDEQLMQEHEEAIQKTYRYNRSWLESSPRERMEQLIDIFGHIGKETAVMPDFKCDYGKNIFAGDYFFANYDCIILDVCPVNIGDYVFLAPRVCIFTATHPVDSGVRSTGLEYGRPVTIGNHVWIGGQTVINPGVTIGGHSVIGSGSVVTRDIPSGVIAAGNPCRVIRPLNDADRDFWKKEQMKWRAKE